MFFLSPLKMRAPSTALAMYPGAGAMFLLGRLLFCPALAVCFLQRSHCSLSWSQVVDVPLTNHSVSAGMCAGPAVMWPISWRQRPSSSLQKKKRVSSNLSPPTKAFCLPLCWLGSSSHHSSSLSTAGAGWC